jgi:hypothetical protein
MEEGKSPKETGISKITGQIVRVRHANKYDGVFIEKIFKEHDIYTEDIDYRKFVIATDNDLPVGCGELKKIGEDPEISCVIAAAEPKYADVEPLIVGHLMEFSSSEKIYITTIRVKEYEKMGFKKVSRKGKELDQALAHACIKDNNAALMVYRK